MSSSSGDLSLCHSYLGAFGALRPAKDPKYRLTKEQVDRFWRDGYLGPIKLLSDDDCDLLLKELESFKDGQHPNQNLLYEYHRNQSGDEGNVLMHCLGHWRIARGFHDLAFHPGIYVPASQLLRKNSDFTGVRFWHDQLFCKPARHGGGVAWHQDYSYWTRTVPMNHLTAHIALDPQNEDNGCIRYIPGSHRWDRGEGKPLPVTDFNFKDMDSIKSVLTPAELASFGHGGVPVTLGRGDVVFHHPLSVHGSFANRSADMPRRAAVINLFGDGTASASDEPLLEGVPVVERGDKLQGQFFPLLT